MGVYAVHQGKERKGKKKKRATLSSCGLTV
jgi:hypothetical protein